MPDDLFVLRILCTVTGVGDALGSALLMAGRPERFTVYGERAQRSLGSAVGAMGWQDEDVSRWSVYLPTCRRVAEATGRWLRTVDRALYSAAGSLALPAG